MRILSILENNTAFENLKVLISYKSCDKKAYKIFVFISICYIWKINNLKDINHIISILLSRNWNVKLTILTILKYYYEFEKEKVVELLEIINKTKTKNIHIKNFIFMLNLIIIEDRASYGSVNIKWDDYFSNEYVSYSDIRSFIPLLREQQITYLILWILNKSEFRSNELSNIICLKIKLKVSVSVLSQIVSLLAYLIHNKLIIKINTKLDNEYAYNVFKVVRDFGLKINSSKIKYLQSCNTNHCEILINKNRHKIINEISKTELSFSKKYIEALERLYNNPNRFLNSIFYINLSSNTKKDKVVKEIVINNYSTKSINFKNKNKLYLDYIWDFRGRIYPTGNVFNQTDYKIMRGGLCFPDIKDIDKDTEIFCHKLLIKTYNLKTDKYDDDFTNLLTFHKNRFIQLIFIGNFNEKNLPLLLELYLDDILKLNTIDAKCSGTQHLAMLFKNQDVGYLVGVFDKPLNDHVINYNDYYHFIAEKSVYSIIISWREVVKKEEIKIIFTKFKNLINVYEWNINTTEYIREVLKFSLPYIKKYEQWTKNDIKKMEKLDDRSVVQYLFDKILKILTVEIKAVIVVTQIIEGYFKKHNENLDLIIHLDIVKDFPFLDNEEFIGIFNIIKDQDNFKLYIREIFKKVVITVQYGATTQTLRQYLIESINKTYKLKIKIEKKYTTPFIILIIQDNAINNYLMIKEIKFLNSILYLSAKNKFEGNHIYLAPDSQLFWKDIILFTVNITAEGKWISEKLKLIITVYTKNENVNIFKIKNTGAVNLTHILDSTALINILWKCINSNTKVIPLHDALMCSPCDTNLVMKICWRTYKEIYNENLLEKMVNYYIRDIEISDRMKVVYQEYINKKDLKIKIIEKSWNRTIDTIKIDFDDNYLSEVNLFNDRIWNKIKTFKNIKEFKQLNKAQSRKSLDIAKLLE